MASRADKVPDWLLERLAAGELPEEQALGLRARLDAQGEDERLAALVTSNAEILAALPVARVVPEIERRAAAARRQTGTRRVRPLLALSMAATCAAGLVMILAVRDHPSAVPPPPHEVAPESIGIKGLSPSLRIHRKTRAGSEMLPASALVRKGDTLQIRYVAAGKRFGIIASIDARGTVTLHLPEAPGPAAALDRDGERALAHAFELDDSPGFERFVFVTSDTPFATADVASYLKNDRPLPAALAAFELTLKKETP
jgi:hypothetical protein